MVASLLPGLRELRAPLAAGDVWLLVAWLAIGDQLPGAEDSKPPPVERLYRLEPIVSQFGLAIVSSVIAYVLGSIAIDLHLRLARLARAIRVDRYVGSHLAIKLALLAAVAALFIVGVVTVGDLTGQLGLWDLVIALAVVTVIYRVAATLATSLKSMLDQLMGYHGNGSSPATVASSQIELQITPQGPRELESWLDGRFPSVTA